MHNFKQYPRLVQDSLYPSVSATPLDARNIAFVCLYQGFKILLEFSLKQPTLTKFIDGRINLDNGTLSLFNTLENRYLDYETCVLQIFEENYTTCSVQIIFKEKPAVPCSIQGILKYFHLLFCLDTTHAYTEEKRYNFARPLMVGLKPSTSIENPDDFIFELFPQDKLIVNTASAGKHEILNYSLLLQAMEIDGKPLLESKSRVGMIVDSDFQSHMKYALGQKELVPGFKLPSNVTLIYARPHKKKLKNLFNQIINKADELTGEVKKVIDLKDIHSFFTENKDMVANVFQLAA